MSSNPTSSSTGPGLGPGSTDPSAARRNSKRPKYSRFTQQELPACKPILTPRWVISAFMLVSVIFIPIGVASLFASRDVVEIVDRYDDICVPGSKSDKIKYIQGPGDKTCTRKLNVSKHMKAPIYIYYQLDNFYQNHRRYVKSRSDQQLRSKKSENEVSACKPEDMIDGKQPIVPCGLIAWSLFNDTYSFSSGNKNISVNKKEISWKSDRDHKFGKDVFPKNFQKGGLIGGGTLNDTIPVSIILTACSQLQTFAHNCLSERIEKGKIDTITLSLLDKELSDKKRVGRVV